MSILIDMADDRNIVETHHILISSLFGMIIVADNDFTETIPSEIELLTGLSYLSLGKWE